jgi:lipopolysaccharide transport system ATP-binding protein
MSDLAIKVENVSKLYQLGSIGTGTLHKDLKRWWWHIAGKGDPFTKIGQLNDRTKTAESDFVWALKDISFEVKKGEVLGIIGNNGAGKSTLLKILSKITSPTMGRIKVDGRIASLLEVGTGFHPELTGRENIFMNGAILGMRKWEIQKKFDEIVDFAGVEAYIDTPVKRYSSGMYVRLAFAVAAFLEPEILIVDEVLAVGDTEFQKKCVGRMKEVSVNDGRTVLFVSHNMAAIQNLCGKGVLLENGTLKFQSDSITEVIGRYLLETNNANSEAIEVNHENEYIRFDKFDIVNDKWQSCRHFFKTDQIFISFHLMFKQVTANLNLGFAMYTKGNQQLLFWSFFRDKNEVFYKNIVIRQDVVLEATIPSNLLNDGEYTIEVIAAIHNIGWLISPGSGFCKTNIVIEGGNYGISLLSSTKRPSVIFPILDYKLKL